MEIKLQYKSFFEENSVFLGSWLNLWKEIESARLCLSISSKGHLAYQSGIKAEDFQPDHFHACYLKFSRFIAV